MTCPSPPVRVSSLPPVVARTSTSSMSDHIFKEGCRPFKDKSSSRKVFKTLVSSLQLQTSVILMCRNVLMSIKQKDKQIFYYCKGTRHHINRLNTIYTQFFTQQTKLQQNWDRKYNNSDLILVKITFILHQYLPCNDRQCNSGKGGSEKYWW